MTDPLRFDEQRPLASMNVLAIVAQKIEKAAAELDLARNWMRARVKLLNNHDADLAVGLFEAEKSAFEAFVESQSA